MFHRICRDRAACCCAAGGLWWWLIHDLTDNHFNRCVDWHGLHKLDGRFESYIHRAARADSRESQESQYVYLDGSRLNHHGATGGWRTGAAPIRRIG
jgi:hypothetical protein